MVSVSKIHFKRIFPNPGKFLEKRMGEFKYDGCDADSPTGVIGLIEYFGAAEVLALSTRLCVVRRGAKHLHNFVVIILKEIHVVS